MGTVLAPRRWATSFTWVAVVAFWFTPASAAGLWTLVGCPPADAERYAQARRRIVEAKPGDDEYVPYPYPKTARHAVESFLRTYRQMTSDEAGRMSREDRQFFARIADGHLRAVVATVANWTPTRCGRKQKIDFYFLIRFFDRSSGREVTRAAANDSGHAAMLVHLDEAREAEQPAPILTVTVPDLSDSRRAVEARLGGPVSAAQLVSAWGNVHCDELMPCVALRAGKSTYLLHRDELWRIANESAFESVRRQYRSRAAMEAFLRRLARGDERLVSVGGDAIAKLVPVSDVRRLPLRGGP